MILDFWKFFEYLYFVEVREANLTGFLYIFELNWMNLN